MKRCEGCPFKFGKLVGGRGDPGSSLVIIGESPGTNEIRENIPFIGPSGDVLNSALEPFPNLNPYILNAHQCFPGSTTTKSMDKVVDATRRCSARLRQEIQPGVGVHRKVILALGNAALWSVTNDYSHKITQVRGKTFDSPLASFGIIASLHPSFLLRGGGSFRQFKADVHYACSLASGRGRYRQYILPKVHVWSSEREIQQFARNLDTNTIVAADTETGGYEGFDHLLDHILCSGFCVDPSNVYVVPGDLSPHARHLFDSHARFVWHNGKFDAKFFRACGVHNVRVDEDTMLLSYAIDESKGVHDLEQISSDLLGMPDWKYMIQPSLAAAKNNHPKGYRVTYADIPQDILYDYMSRDISATAQCFPILRQLVASDAHLERLYTRVLIPTSEYLVNIEEKGMHLDLSQVEENERRLNEEVEKYRQVINDIGLKHGLGDTNPNSPAQLATLLYDTLHLQPVERRHKPTRSTDEDSLDKLPDHPAVQALKKYRKVKKAQSTYVTAAKDHLDAKGKPVSGWVNPISGRVHTTYKIHGTATGRLASEDPNLLNIPRDPMLRGQFVAANNYVFMEVDTNQAELRVLAELSQDPELTRIYTTTGLSIHDEVREDLFGDPRNYSPTDLDFYLDKFNVRHHGPDKWLQELKAEQKMKAKNVNFGIPYGISAFGLAEQIDDTPQVAQQYLDRWYKKFKGARTFLLKCRESVSLNKVFVTPFGRKRRFGVVGPERLNEQQNQASNFPMQSIASDIVLVTGIYMAPRAQKVGVHIVNTVYDSILYEAPYDIPLLQDLAAETIDRLGVSAKEWGIKRIPITGEAKVGKRWGQLKELPVWLDSQSRDHKMPS